MNAEHSCAGARALRQLTAGRGGGVLVVRGEAPPYYAGVQRPPARTLLEAVLTFTADPSYHCIAVFSGVGPHLPRLQVGERLVVGRLAAGWLARGQSRPEPATAPALPPTDGDDADYDRFFREQGAAGPADLILFHSQSPDWAVQLLTVLQHVERLCGVNWNGYRHLPLPDASVPRSLILLDEALLRPTAGQVNAVVTGATRPPTEAERAALEARFRSLPRLLRESPVDLILVASSSGIGDLLRKGTLAREEVPELPGCRPQLFPELRWDVFAEATLPAGGHGRYLDDKGQSLSRYDAFRTLPAASPHTPLQDLEAMIGLASVKEQVTRLQARAWENQRRRQLGLQADEFHLHTIFYGNPGTGKTRVASILARIFLELGLLSGDKVTVVTPSHLIAEYVGQTRPRTQRTLREALGGVLFIDEAYGLMPREGNSFAEDCIEEMLPWLTEHRRQLAVILAGYPAQMRELLARVNQGFAGRFQNHLNFPDYTDDELVQICHAMTRSSGDELAPACDEVIRGKLQQHRLACGPRFRNAGEVEKLLDRVREVRAQRLRRLASPTVEDFRRFLAGDFQHAQLTAAPQTP
jgi:hypothetical protein